MSGSLLGPEGSPIIAGEDDDPEDASERCEVCGGTLAPGEAHSDCGDPDECGDCGSPKAGEHFATCSIWQREDPTPEVHGKPSAWRGPPTYAKGDTEPAPPRPFDAWADGEGFKPIPAMYRPIVLPTTVVATPDGVFVGEALEAHQRATQTPRPARVTSIGGRVEREILLLGALSEIVAAWDDVKADHNLDTKATLISSVERARALLVEGSK